MDNSLAHSDLLTAQAVIRRPLTVDKAVIRRPLTVDKAVSALL